MHLETSRLSSEEPSKETGKHKEEEQLHLKEDPLRIKDETQSLRLKIKSLEEENEKLKHQLEGNREKSRVLGLDTLAEVVDKMRADFAQGPVCGMHHKPSRN